MLKKLYTQMVKVYLNYSQRQDLKKPCFDYYIIKQTDLLYWYNKLSINKNLLYYGMHMNISFGFRKPSNFIDLSVSGVM